MGGWILKRQDSDKERERGDRRYTRRRETLTLAQRKRGGGGF